MQQGCAAKCAGRCHQGARFFHFQQLAHLAAVELIGPPLHQFGAVFKVGPPVVSSPRAIALDVAKLAFTLRRPKRQHIAFFSLVKESKQCFQCTELLLQVVMPIVVAGLNAGDAM